MQYMNLQRIPDWVRTHDGNEFSVARPEGDNVKTDAGIEIVFDATEKELGVNVVAAVPISHVQLRWNLKVPPPNSTWVMHGSGHTARRSGDRLCRIESCHGTSMRPTRM